MQAGRVYRRFEEEIRKRGERLAVYVNESLQGQRRMLLVSQSVAREGRSI